MREEGRRHWRLGLVGFGSVGRAFARLLLDAGEELSERHGFTTSVGLIATRRSGVAVASDGAKARGGIDLEDSLAGSLNWRRGTLAEALPSGPVDIIFELTPLDRVAGEPATSHIRAAFDAGIHVVTANKGPIAFHGPELREEAARLRLGLRAEATLMDCLPVFALLDASVPVGRIDAFAAVPNSTSNFVVEQMAAGGSREAAIAEAQRLGIAETDPSADLEGWDGAFKAAILAQVLLGRDVRPGDVERVGLSGVDPGEPAAARACGERLRFVARGRRDGAPVRVAPERVPGASVLGAASGFSMALEVDTQFAGRLGQVLIEPHVPQTAYALLMDLVALDRAVGAGTIRAPRVEREP